MTLQETAEELKKIARHLEEEAQSEGRYRETNRCTFVSFQRENLADILAGNPNNWRGTTTGPIEIEIERDRNYGYRAVYDMNTGTLWTTREFLVEARNLIREAKAKGTASWIL